MEYSRSVSFILSFVQFILKLHISRFFIVFFLQAIVEINRENSNGVINEKKIERGNDDSKLVIERYFTLMCDFYIFSLLCLVSTVLQGIIFVSTLIQEVKNDSML